MAVGLEIEFKKKMLENSVRTPHLKKLMIEGFSFFFPHYN